MAEVIVANGIDPSFLAEQAIHLQPDIQAQNYFQQNYQNFINKISGLAEGFANKVKQTYDLINDSNLIRKAKEIITRSSNIVYNDRIYHITFDNIQDAGYMMREFILAEPTLFNYYQHNRLSGWNDMVYLPEQNISPEWRDDYLNTIDGIVMFNEEGQGFVKHISLDYDNPFSIAERIEIQNAWDVAAKLIAAGEDPTSPRD